MLKVDVGFVDVTALLAEAVAGIFMLSRKLWRINSISFHWSLNSSASVERNLHFKMHFKCEKGSGRDLSMQLFLFTFQNHKNLHFFPSSSIEMLSGVKLRNCCEI